MHTFATGTASIPAHAGDIDPGIRILFGPSPRMRGNLLAILKQNVI